jgi:hypothetical protein
MVIIIIIQFHIFILRGARPHVHYLAYLLDSAQCVFGIVVAVVVVIWKKLFYKKHF